MSPTLRSLMLIFCLSPASVKALELKPQMFAEKAAISDMFEIEAAKLEIQNGKSDKIKAFAKQMVTDHSASTNHLKEASRKEGVTLPVKLDTPLQNKLDALRPLRDVELDAAYASTQISIHTEAVALFGGYSKDGKGGPLKAFAAAMYPTIRMHLVHIQGLNSGD